MKIGVDLDNTLICYDKAVLSVAIELGYLSSNWVGSREQVKQHIRQAEGGEKSWRKLQGKVYGKWISRAEIYMGVHRFLWRCKTRGIHVDIISHKTEFGHYDREQVPLREAALEFLVKNGLYTKTNSLIDGIKFCSTRQEKLAEIRNGQYDYFIDDLPEVLDASVFPSWTKKILFRSSVEVKHLFRRADSWAQIEWDLLGDWQPLELTCLGEEVIGDRPRKSTWVGGRGNSGVVKCIMSDDTEIALKIYANDGDHDRLWSEYAGSHLMRASGILNVPNPITSSRFLNAAAYSWVSGSPGKELTKAFIENSVVFVAKLKQLSKTRKALSFQNASAAVLSGHALETQVGDRIESFLNGVLIKDDIRSYIIDELIPTANNVIQISRQQWPSQFAYNEELPRSELSLSPSDFGFHNALENQLGDITFIDFEYFGWDDPAKLIGDFLLHPAMNLSMNLKHAWLTGARDIFGNSTINRMEAMLPMLQLCWSLILLNDFREDVFYRRQLANKENYKIGEVQLSEKLKLSKIRLEKLRNPNYASSIMSLIN